MGAHWVASFINDSGREFLSEHKVEKEPDRRQPMTTHPPPLPSRRRKADAGEDQIFVNGFVGNNRRMLIDESCTLN